MTCSGIHNISSVLHEIDDLRIPRAADQITCLHDEIWADLRQVGGDRLQCRQVAVDVRKNRDSHVLGSVEYYSGAQADLKDFPSDHRGDEQRAANHQQHTAETHEDEA